MADTVYRHAQRFNTLWLLMPITSLVVAAVLWFSGDPQAQLGIGIVLSTTVVTLAIFGRLVVELARRGWRVTGNDLSRPMLDYARARLREEGLSARLVHGDMAELELAGRFDLAHCLVSTFKYLLSERAATRHLERVADLLVPGGLYCLGFHLTDYDNLRFDRERWVVDEGDTRVVCNIQAWPADPGRRRERMRSRMRITEAGRVHEQETHWWFRTWDARQVRRLLRREPRLELVAVHDFRYDPEVEITLEEGFDVLLVLRRRPD